MRRGTVLPFWHAGFNGVGIALEKKFEGLWTPHKVKMAVSACPRRAVSGIKDIGFIGIDGGWEIYVGGMEVRIFAEEIYCIK